MQRRIQAMTQLLLEYPRVGKAIRNRRLRQILATPYPYLIYYEVTEDEIIIHGIRHSARNPLTMPGH